MVGVLRIVGVYAHDLYLFYCFTYNERDFVICWTRPDFWNLEQNPEKMEPCANSIYEDIKSWVLLVLLVLV